MNKDELVIARLREVFPTRPGLFSSPYRVGAMHFRTALQGKINLFYAVNCKRRQCVKCIAPDVCASAF